MKNNIIACLLLMLLWPAAVGAATATKNAVVSEKKSQAASLPTKKAPVKKRKDKKNAVPVKKETFVPTYEVLATAEVNIEEALPSVESKVAPPPKKNFAVKIGGMAGFFSGGTSFLGQLEFPLKMIIGPATSSVRISTGLMQSRETDKRYVPLNFDFLLNYPPGWFSGVDNYIGCGLNLVVLGPGRKMGSIGGEVFYGVVGDGFGGSIFGEIGYAALSTGDAAGYQGMTVMVGYKKLFEF